MKKFFYIVFNLLMMFFICETSLADKLIYDIQNFRVIYSNGEIMSGSQSDVSFSGQMILEGDRLTQDITINGQNVTVSGKFQDVDSTGEILTFSYSDGFTNDLIVISWDPLITLTDTSTYSPYNPAGLSYCEVDIWTNARIEPTSYSSKTFSNEENDSVVGGLIGSVLADK